MNNIAVVGAGTMGNGIAHVFAQAGFNVTLIDVNPGQVVKAMETIGKNLDRQVTKGSITEEQKQSTLKNISATHDMWKGVANAELIIEAATENTEIKLTLFEEIDKAAPAGCILASNTSSISITKIAAVTKRPDMVIG